MNLMERKHYIRYSIRLSRPIPVCDLTHPRRKLSHTVNSASIFLTITYAALLPLIQPPPESVPVGIRAQVKIQKVTLDHLRREVDVIYAAAQVQIDWVPDDGNPLIQVLLQARPRHSVVTGCSRNLHDHRLGLTSLDSRLVVLWADQVARGAAGDWDSKKPPRLPREKLGRALGRVLAHELGHLFMRSREHRSRGLMRASLKHRDLTFPDPRRLFFSEEDVEKMKQGLKEMLRQFRAGS